MEGWWADLGRIEHVTPQMGEKAEAGINEILKVRKTGDIVAARDNVLLQTLKAKVGDKKAAVLSTHLIPQVRRS